MNRSTQIVIVILALILMFVLGLLIPSQFNDKALVNHSKESVEKQQEEEEQKKQEQANLPQNMPNEKFSAKFEEQSNLGKDFVQKYYNYDFKEPTKSFDESLEYVSGEYKKEQDLSNDATKMLLKRESTINGIEPVQSSSDKDKVTFKYDVDLKETYSEKGFNENKAKKDEKYFKKLKTSDTTTNKVITITFSLKDNKIIDLKSNYL